VGAFQARYLKQIFKDPKLSVVKEEHNRPFEKINKR
jgi:hypothetical protein